VQSITAELARYQKTFDDTNIRLTNAQKALDATTKPDDRTKLMNNVQSIAAELTTYQNSLVTYKTEADKFSALILDGQKTVDNLKKQAAAAAASAPNQAPALTAASAAAPNQAPALTAASAAAPIQSPPLSDAAGVAFVAGPDNKMIELKPTGGLVSPPTYYEPGTYKFGSSTYVPSYEDSVYLSKTTGQSSTSSYLDPATMMGGACSYYKDQPEKLEEMCLAVDKNNCGAMSCCVLLGGSKCVSGDVGGPRNKLNYGDITLRDKDYYYHDGKCYGNCKP